MQNSRPTMTERPLSHRVLAVFVLTCGLAAARPATAAEATPPAPEGAAATAAPAAASSPAAAVDPWRVLVGVRESLVGSGAVVADFVQTYTPAGFATGERESGKVALALPTCLRWDYELPSPKTFLLCGKLVYQWNPGEKSGRRALVDRDREPGLDLLFLTVDELRRRYRGSARALDARRVEVSLEPLAGDVEAQTATLVVDPQAGHLDSLSYQDGDGSVTRFALTGWRNLDDERSFTPPKIEWVED